MKLPRPSFDIADTIDAMVGYWDRELRCRYANAAYKTWFGRSPDTMSGIPMQELLGPLFELNLPHIEGALDGVRQSFERAIPLPDGTVRQSLASYFPDTSDGTLRGFSVHVADVTGLKLREQQLQEACSRAQESAAHDFLTGLPNRVNLLSRIEEAITSAAESGLLAAVVVMDLDCFKEVNDTYGHLFGDRVLQVVGERMMSSIRERQRIKRLGGDEFVLIVPNARSRTGVAQMVRRLQDIVCRPCVVGGVPVNLSMSCGVALFPGDGSTPETLLRRSDEALYLTKKRSKGSIIFATS
jgi:diguanylate cyclase (GGDEF)-like protein/PAS domain S-box-containing protein